MTDCPDFWLALLNFFFRGGLWIFVLVAIGVCGWRASVKNMALNNAAKEAAWAMHNEHMALLREFLASPRADDPNSETEKSAGGL